VLLRTPRFDDQSYQDFVEGLRAFSGETMSRPAMMALHGALGAPPIPAPRVDRLQLRNIGDAQPLLATRNRLLRSSQEMMWRNLNESFGTNRAAIETALKDAESRGPGSLEWSADFPIPEYTQREFHVQPGGYQGNALTGPVYHYGTKVFFVGTNNQDEVHAEIIAAAPAPADGRVNNVLDIACSIGQGSTALKQRFPNAKVTAIDVAVPLLRYAHYRASRMGSEVHFKQRIAEQTGFADGEFDLVQSTILFHEVPFAKTREIVREIHRVLRPGGVFSIMDFPSDGPIPAGLQYFLDIDHQYNGEPYSLEFVYADFSGVLRDAGFEVQAGPMVARYLRSWRCVKKS
jgi:ubiquinone/menaquinone biosynthesis C-methylase UbiE